MLKQKQIILKRENLILPFLLLLTTFLRFYKISALSIWTDEGISLKVATSNISNIILMAASDVHPPFFYIVLHYWVLLFGKSEMALRSLSALAGIGAVLLIYLITSRFLNKRVALITTGVSTISPFLIWYAQEARSYSLLLFFTLLSTYLLLIFFSSGSKTVLLAYIFVTVASLYTHYYALWILLVQFLFLLIEQRRHSKLFYTAIGAQLLSSIIFLPWLFIAAQQLVRGQEERVFNIFSLPKTFLLLSLGRSIDIFRLGKVIHAKVGNPFIDSLIVIISMATISYLLLQGFRYLRRDKEQLYAVSLYFLLPIFLVSLLSLWRPIFDSKSFIVVFPPFAMLIGVGIFSQERKGLLILSSLLVILSMVYSLANFYFNPVLWKEDFRGASLFLKKQRANTVFVQPFYMHYALKYYFQGELLPVNRKFSSYNEARKYLKPLIKNRSRFWLLKSAHPQTDPQKCAERYFLRKYNSVVRVNLAGLKLIYFIKK
jgi:uncharacterized membrane protein